MMNGPVQVFCVARNQQSHACDSKARVQQHRLLGMWSLQSCASGRSELTHVTTRVAAHYPKTPPLPPPPPRVMVAQPAQVTPLTQVSLILVHAPVCTVPQHSPSGGLVTRHNPRPKPPPPPWLGKLRRRAIDLFNNDGHKCTMHNRPANYYRGWDAGTIDAGASTKREETPHMIMRPAQKNVWTATIARLTAWYRLAPYVLQWYNPHTGVCQSSNIRHAHRDAHRSVNPHPHPDTKHTTGIAIR